MKLESIDHRLVETYKFFSGKDIFHFLFLGFFALFATWSGRAGSCGTAFGLFVRHSLGYDDLKY